MTVRFGLFGTGHWAVQTHAAGLARNAAVELAGVWGRDPAKTAAVAEQLGTRAYDGVSALITDVDAIAVALPPDVQAGIAAEAAEAGRHLLLDKPLAFTTADADRVVAAVDAGQLSSRVFFTARFTPETEQWLQQLAADGDWDGGQVTMLANIYRAGSPYAGSSWRSERGALWDIGPHALSQLIPVLGPVSRVVAAAGRGDTVSLALTHASGASSTATVSLTAPEPSRHERCSSTARGASRVDRPAARPTTMPSTTRCASCSPRSRTARPPTAATCGSAATSWRCWSRRRSTSWSPEPHNCPAAYWPSLCAMAIARVVTSGANAAAATASPTAEIQNGARRPSTVAETPPAAAPNGTAPRTMSR
jgi:hypothetical protein